jgi:hypothetical protein
MHHFVVWSFALALAPLLLAMAFEGVRWIGTRLAKDPATEIPGVGEATFSPERF